MGSSSAAEADAVVAELERVAGRLQEELAGWRQRCRQAEADLESSRDRVPQVTLGEMNQLRQRVGEVEAENETLRERIAQAREQLEQLRTRLRFVGDQVGGEVR